MIHEVYLPASDYGPLHDGTETGLIVDCARLILEGHYLRVHEVRDDAIRSTTGRKRLVEVKALERVDGTGMIVCEIEILIKGVG